MVESAIPTINNYRGWFYLNLLFLCFFSIPLSANNNFKDGESATDTIQSYLQKEIIRSLDRCNQNPDSALIWSTNALEIANTHNLEKQKAELLRIIGLVWYYKADFAKSLEYLRQSNALYQKIQDKAGEASSLNNIALLYHFQGYTDKAIEMDKQVLDMRLKIGDSTKIANSYNNIAIAYHDMKDYRQALIYYMNAVAIYIKTNHLEDIDVCYNNIGNLYFETNKPDSAFFFFKKSLSYSVPLNHKQTIGNSYGNLGEYYLQSDSLQIALEYMQKALRNFQEIGIVYEIEWAAESLYMIYEKMGDHKKALENHKLFKQMADSSKKMDIVQSITRIESETKFEKERQLEQIVQANKDLATQLEMNKQKQTRNVAIIAGFALLILAGVAYRNYLLKSKDNKRLIEQKEEIIAQKEEIQSQRDSIEALNKTKDKLFAIIAHDLKNPLGGVYNLCGIIRSEYDTINSEKLKLYLEHLHISAEKAYVLLDNLLQWASLQLGSIAVNPQHFNLLSIMRDNTELMTGYASQKNIAIQYESWSECTAYGDPLLASTVIRNLITNALKFTPDNGSVSINLKSETDHWVISIADTGIGIAPEDQKILFEFSSHSKNIGSSKNKGTGLGIILCKEFTELNGGQIWLESRLGSGSTFFFSIPKEAKK